MITASLVLYNNSIEMVTDAIESFLKSAKDGLLIVVDNSPTALSHPQFAHHRVRYIFSGRNLGFGKGHNLAIKLLPAESEYHLLLNPDVIFGAELVSGIRMVFEKDSTIGAVMPRINYVDGSQQHLCKLLPTPVDLIFRRFIPLNQIRKLVDDRYELRQLPQNSLSDVPNLSGCCLFVRTNLLKQLNGFDERFFMYLEDVDLVRRIGNHARTVYVPSLSVVHLYSRGSYHNYKLLGYHVKSAWLYFCKWGWLFDPTRVERNRRALKLVRGANKKWEKSL